MKILRLCLLGLLFGGSLAATAAPAWLDAEIKSYNSAKTPSEFFKKTSVLTKLEKKRILNLLKLKTKLHPLTVERGADTTFTINQHSLKIVSAEKRLIEVNHHYYTIPAHENAFALVDKLLELSAKQTAAHEFWRLFLPEAAADADHIDMTCVTSGQWKLNLRSPEGLLDSQLGYLEYLALAGFGLELIDKLVVSHFTDACDAQVAALKQLSKESHIALKQLDCGDDYAGSDTSIEFWVPQTGKKHKLAVRKFNLDYTRRLANELPEADPDDDDNDDDSDATTKNKDGTGQDGTECDDCAAKGKAYKTTLYDFGVSNLNRTWDFITEDGSNRCEEHTAADPNFQKIADDIEPFRKQFAYLINQRSCYECKSQIRRQVSCPTPPPSLIKYKNELERSEKQKLPDPSVKSAR